MPSLLTQRPSGLNKIGRKRKHFMWRWKNCFDLSRECFVRVNICNCSKSLQDSPNRTKPGVNDIKLLISVMYHQSMAIPSSWVTKLCYFFNYYVMAVNYHGKSLITYQEIIFRVTL